MLDINYIEKIYSLEENSVKDLEENPQGLFIHVEFKRKVHTCPFCSATTNKIKDYRLQKVKLDSMNHTTTFALINKRRYVCPHCGKTFYEEASIAGKYQRRSIKEVMNIIGECANKQSFTDIVKRYCVSLPTVIRYFSKITISAPSALPEVLSIDEFKGNATGQKYQVAIVDPATKRPLDILPERNTDKIIRYFLKNFTFSQRKKVILIVTDLSALFRKVIHTIFPCAKIVADKFHVARLVTWAMERVRKRVQNEIKSERIYFKRSKYLLNKNQDKLKPEEVTKLETMLIKSKDLTKAYWLKETFKRLFKTDILNITRFLDQWLDLVASSKLVEFSSVLKTFKEWRSEILRSFISRYSNGYIEGHNNKIKVIKRISFGIKSLKILRLRVLYMA